MVVVNPTQEMSNFPTEFQRQTVELIANLIQASSLRFFVINPHMSIKGSVTHNLGRDAELHYQQKYWRLDPMHPHNFADTKENVICSHKMMPREQWLESTIYQDFFKPRGLMHDVDIFLRRGDVIVAVLSILRADSEGEFTDDELMTLGSLRPYLEYTLNTVYVPARYEERKSISEKYALTDRELDVVEIVLTGAPNKVISNELDVSLPTVRTHLQHIFEKVSVHSTNELIVRVFRDLGLSLPPGRE